MACEIRPYEDPKPPEYPEWQHKLVKVGQDPKTGRRWTVTAGLHYLRDNDLPYFSVTATSGQDGGRAVEEITRTFPELESVNRLHLADAHGVPLHAFENGWYFLSGYFGGFGERYHAGNTKRQHWKEDGTFDGYRESTPEECLAFAAELVRVPGVKLRTLADAWHADQSGDRVGIKTLFAEWVILQRTRWDGEAREAIELLDRLIAEGGKA